jgi:Rhs family protein
LVFFGQFAIAGNTAGTPTNAQSGNDDGDPCGNPGPPTIDIAFGGGGDPSPIGSDPLVGDPIHTLTGNSYQKVKLFRCRGDFPLTFSWHYNSRMRLASSFRGQWSYTYGEHLEIGTTNITLHMADGKQIVFDVDGTDISLTLRNSSEAAYGRLAKVGNDYVYGARSNREYIFDQTGKLIEIKNNRGLSHVISDQTVSGVYTRTVTHSNGQTLAIEYGNGSDRLPTLVRDAGGIEYTFSSTLISSLQEELLDSIIYPDYLVTNDSIVTFNYLTSHSNPAPNWDYQTALTAIIDEEGWQKAAWEYSPEGYATRNYLGDPSDATEVYDVTPVEAEPGPSQHSAYVTTPYGCQIRYVYHSYRKGQQYQVLPWLNYVKGEDTSAGCSFIGTLKHYGKFTNGSDWQLGGLENNGYPNVFQDNVYQEQSGWDSSARKNTIHKTSYLNADGTTKTVVSKDVYEYHTSLRRATNVKRYEGANADELWSETQYVHYDGVADAVDNGRLKSKTVIDHRPSDNAFQNRIRTWQYLYQYHDTDNKIVSRKEVIDPRGKSTVTTYTPEGYVESVTNAANHTVTYSNFTSSGLPQTVIDVNGVTSSLVYTPRNWLQSSTTAGRTTTYDYYKNGLTKRVTQPDGTWLEHEYSTARVLKKTTYSNGDYVTYSESYDRTGTHLKTKVTSWFKSGETTPSSTTTYIYDALDRLVSVAGAAGVETQYFYEDARFPKKATKVIQKGDSTYPDVTTLTSYTPRGLVHKSVTSDIPDINNPDVTYTYNATSSITSVTDSNNNTTTYEYTGFNQLLSLTSPDTLVTLYDYDAAGNRTLKIDADFRVTEYQYDALNRLRVIHFPFNTAENIGYSYDDTGSGSYGIGRLTGVFDSSGGESFIYDQFGRVKQKSAQIETATYRWEYDYDAAGNPIFLGYPSGREVNYIRDPLTGRIGSITSRDWSNAPLKTIASSFEYEAYGGVSKFTYGNGVVTDVVRDTNKRITDIILTGSQSVMDWAYGFNSLSDITSITDRNNSALNRTYQYDGKQRLDGATGPFGTYAYTYDDVGNRLTVNKNGQTSVYNYTNSYTGVVDSNRLQSIDTGGVTRSFGYDETGNIVTDSKDNKVFEYNENNRLIKATTPSGVTDYVYNSRGQRVAKKSTNISAGATHFQYAGPNLLGEYNGQGSIIKEYIYGDGSLLAIAAPSSSSDTDADGLDDDWELQYFGDLTKDGTADTDNDGISDLNEFTSGYDPTTADSYVANIADQDADGLPDYWETTYYPSNTSVGASDDSDGDGLTSLQEYQDGSDPTDNRSGGAYGADADNDGMKDRWEVWHFATITRDGLGDFDGEGVSDLQEFLDNTDPTNGYSAGVEGADVDGDGLPDTWEYSYFATLSYTGLDNPDGDIFDNLAEYRQGFSPTESDTNRIAALLNILF